MTKLSVNVNKIALLRNSRTIDIPNLLHLSQTCIDAGCQGITVHPRPDERHITEKDVYDLAEIVDSVEYNIEGNPFPRFLDIVRKVKPTQATLVPDDPAAFTSDHGWDLEKEGNRLLPIVQELHDLGVRVSLFMDPDPNAIERAKGVGADRIELYTEPYATAHRDDRADPVFQEYAEAAKVARDLGLGINAGHDLNLANLGQFITIPQILEVSIGHALIGDALEMGLSQAVKAYLKVLSTAE